MLIDNKQADGRKTQMVKHSTQSLFNTAHNFSCTSCVFVSVVNVSRASYMIFSGKSQVNWYGVTGQGIEMILWVIGINPVEILVAPSQAKNIHLQRVIAIFKK